MKLFDALAVLVLVVGCGDDNHTTTSTSGHATSVGEERAEEALETEAPEAETRPANPNAIVIVPGQSVGPIRLGMSRAEVEALGVLSPHPDYSAMTIPYTVYYDDAGMVGQVEVTLSHAPVDIQVGATTVPRGADYAAVKNLLGDCGPDDLAVGGTSARCGGGDLIVNIGSGNPDEVWLRITDLY